MKKALSLAIVTLFLQSIFGQKPTIRVLAENGLRLREGPSETSKILAVAPFWSEVEVLDSNWPHTDKKQYQIDTGGVAYVYERCFEDIYEKNIVLNIGQWIPVQFSGKKGFMYSGFLGVDRNHFLKKELNSDLRIRHAGSDFQNSSCPDFNPKWHWHGLFHDQKGWQIRPVKLRYLGEFNAYNSISTLTTDSIQPFWIFGSKNEWPMRRVDKEGDFSETFWEESAINIAAIKKVGLDFRVEKKGKRSNWVWSVALPDGKFQILEPSGGAFYNTILFVGDLDGDGKRDYIFEKNGIGGMTDLWLSSIAQEGEAVRLAARISYFGC